MLKHTWLLLFCIFFYSCKKDKLEGDYERFKGTWKWSYTVVNNWDTAGLLPNDTIFSKNCDDNYELELLEKGIIKSLKNGKVKERKRIVVDQFGQTVFSGYVAIIHLNGNDSKRIGLRIQEEGILSTQNSEFTGLPFNNDDFSQIKYNSYFLRQ